jgi:NAD(P) transhydrogenase subunit alpha
MVETMKPGAVIVDLAASTGGNCELTRAGEVVTHAGVQVHGPRELASRTAGDASEMYSRNVASLLEYLFGEGGHADDPDDEIATATCLVRDGAIVDDRVLAAFEERAS